MGWGADILAICFIITGILCVFYTRRFAEWWIRYSYEHRLNYFTSKWKDEGLTREDVESRIFHYQPYRFIWLFWLWGIRIMGVLLAAAGVIVLSLNFIQ